MLYHSINELPESVRETLPEHAQDIYRAAFNSAYVQYGDEKKRRSDKGREEASDRIAWSAVKQLYVKHQNGEWAERK